MDLKQLKEYIKKELKNLDKKSKGVNIKLNTPHGGARQEEAKSCSCCKGTVYPCSGNCTQCCKSHNLDCPDGEISPIRGPR